MSELVAIGVGILVSLFTGYNTYLFSTIEVRLTEKFDKRYVSQKETDMLVRERDSYRSELSKRLDSIEQSINDIKQLLMDRHK